MSTATDDYRSAVPPHLDSWDLADPARLLRDLAAATPLTTGRSLLVQVARPATDQVLVAHTDAWPSGQPEDECAAREALEDAMRRLGHRDGTWDDDVRMTSVVITVVIREGRAITRSSDFAVDSVLRYANNTFQALRGELLIVTPHGWISCPDELAGLEPVAVVPRSADGVAVGA